MKWYQHQTNSRNDPKVKSLIAKFGMQGYGLYHLVNEIIAEKIEDNPRCILEYSNEILALEANMKVEDVIKILDFAVSVKLLTQVNFDEYQNLKVKKYCDNWTKRKASNE